MRTAPRAIVKVAALALWLSVGVSGQTVLATLSGDLVALLLGGQTAPVRVIVRGDVAVIQGVALRDGLPLRRVLDGMVVLEATPPEISALRTVSGITGISRDVLVSPLMTVAAKAMAADQARAGTSGSLGIGAYPAASGKGVGVAVIDSGISTSHAALSGKVTASVSFVAGDTSTADAFGHGTHIAGIIAGQAGPASTVTTQYQGGVAPGAHLVNVRVLDGEGRGFTSDVTAGIQWTVANRGKYAIKIINLSLGHPQILWGDTVRGL